MADTWKYKYNEHEIVVKNDTDTELLVDDQIQDRKSGLHFSVELTGKLNSGENIKVQIGGVFGMKCSLFVDNVLLNPIEEK